VLDEDFKNPNAHHLTHEEALERDAAIEKIESYQLALFLHERARYEGYLMINIRLNANCLFKDTDRETDIFLDFHGE